MIARKQWLDIAKGIGICCVVAYHSSEGIKNTFTDASPFIIKLADYFVIWLMPMFFIVSGMLVFNSINKNNKDKVISKIKDWIYIYLIWSVIIYLTRLSLNSITNTNMEASEIFKILWDPMPTIWFIYALLLSFVLMWLTHKLPSKIVLPLAIVLNLLNGYFLGWFEGSIFERVAWIFFFYALGYYHHALIINAIEKSKINSFLSLCFVILTLLYWQLNINIPFYFKPVLSCFVTFLFLHFCHFIFKIKFLDYLSNFMTYIGSISLFIYLTHFPIPAAVRALLIKLNLYNEIVVLLLAVCIAMIVGACAHYLSKKTKVKFLFVRPKLIFNLPKLSSNDQR
jgi:fucose 4-O-acetylase-like acetyltransferase